MPPRDEGQATVELAVLLPVLAVVLLGAWQCVLAAQAHWSAGAAARAAARAHAVGTPELAAARRALPESLDRGVSVDAGDPDGVAVRLRIPTVVPGLELGTLTARASFAAQR